MKNSKRDRYVQGKRMAAVILIGSVFGAQASAAFAAGSWINSGGFDYESSPADQQQIRNDSGRIEYITSDDWVVYSNFNFGAEANSITIEAAGPFQGGQIELHTGSPNGPLIATVDIHHTGGWQHYQPFDAMFPESISGVHDIYLKFIDSNGAGGFLFNTKDFIIDRRFPDRIDEYSDDEDGDGIPALLEYAVGMHPRSRDALPFDFNVQNTGASSVEVRVRNDEYVRTKLQITDDLSADSWQDVTLIYTNGQWQTDHAEFTVGEAVSVGDDLYTVRLESAGADESLFIRLAAEVPEGDLHVYDPVPGGEHLRSPYYSFSVQKVSDLNSSNLAEVTNWETPFNWFTRCVDADDPGPVTAYFSGRIGGWSHTYCNIELDPNTPIVVKIHRYTQAELSALGMTTTAPLGGIKSAAPHPADKVDSCEIIDGDVYVTLRNPAQVSIDIDGQLDGRDAPRVTPFPNWWGGSETPYNNEAEGAHAVSIFANPFLEGKPDPYGAGVKRVHPGDPMPNDDGSWTTLYFMPGIHRMSVDADGDDREWRPEDVYKINSNRQYYIPGDAILYGNFHDKDWLGVKQENVRLFGHGTLCGTKIVHWYDFSDELDQIDPDHSWLRVCQIASAENCTIEGLTVADPAEHGIYFYAGDSDYSPNYIKWVKVISWRVNNDGMHASGNSYIEDCFIRHQDDAFYVDGMGIRRIVLWSDCNGLPLRLSKVLSSRRGSFPASLPQKLVVEDIDIIYARSVWGGAIVAPAGPEEPKTYADGTLNTGQHVIFRNITVSDPHPQRSLFGFDLSSTANRSFAGLTFENIQYQHPHTFGLKGVFRGAATSPIKYFVLDDVYIAGEKVDQAYMNSDKIDVGSDVSDFTFR